MADEKKPMMEAFRRLPGKERLEFALTITLIAIGLLAVVAVLFS